MGNSLIDSLLAEAGPEPTPVPTPTQAAPPVPPVAPGDKVNPPEAARMVPRPTPPVTPATGAVGHGTPPTTPKPDPQPPKRKYTKPAQSSESVNLNALAGSPEFMELVAEKVADRIAAKLLG